MKRKCEHSELTGTQTRVWGIARSALKGRALKTRRKCIERKLRNSRTNMTGLILELFLEVLYRFSVRDLCQRVSPVCTKCRILAKHPCIREHLPFGGKHISTSSVSYWVGYPCCADWLFVVYITVTPFFNKSVGKIILHKQLKLREVKDSMKEHDGTEKLLPGLSKVAQNCVT